MAWRRAMPSRTVFVGPPVSWIVIVRRNGPSSSPSARISPAIWFDSHPTEDQHPGEVRVPGIAGDRAAQHIHRLAFAAHAAAGAVAERDDAVDIREFGEEA